MRTVEMTTQDEAQSIHIERTDDWGLERRIFTASKALSPQEKRRRIDAANIQIVKLARQAVKTFRRAS